MTADTAGSDDSGADELATSAFAFDEQTLGQSTSVFDDGVGFVAPAAPPIAGMAPQQPPTFERELTATERRQRIRLEARRVRRVVRHIELWSVLKVSLIFFFVLWLISMVAGLLLWSFAEGSGTLESVEGLIESLFALEEEQDFWKGRQLFNVYAISTLVLSIAGVTFSMLMALLYNLISDLTGGVRVTVIEEESARFRPPARRAR